MQALIDGSRIEKRMKELDRFHEPGSRFTRRAFTTEYFEARDWLSKEMKRCGLSVRTDAAGNLVGRREGLDPSLPTIMMGSHIDTVKDGGRYDGIIGVIGGLEIAYSLQEKDLRLNHSLEIVDFLAEEPSVFGISTIGSRGISGRLSNHMLDLQDSDYRILRDMIREIGGNPDKLHKPLYEDRDIKAFLELHIEQGPVLEEEQINLGIVTGISGISRYQIKVNGNQGHAGTVPMSQRQDALVCASKMVVSIQNIISRHLVSDDSLVGTVGAFNVFPNHSNVIPGRVEFSLEIRGLKEEIRKEVENKIIDELGQTAELNQCSLETIKMSQLEPVRSDKNLISLLEHSCKELDFSYKHMVSGAGHDTSHMSNLTPVAMVFIPCRNGLSHHPDEFTSIDHIVQGTQVLVSTILKLDQLN